LNTEFIALIVQPVQLLKARIELDYQQEENEKTDKRRYAAKINGDIGHGFILIVFSLLDKKNTLLWYNLRPQDVVPFVPDTNP